MSQARRFRWAATLAVLAGAGAMASAQAADHDRAMASLTESLACTQGVGVEYDMVYDQQIGGFAVAGVALDSECSGVDAVVTVLDTSGEALAVQAVELARGASVSFADSGPLDARLVGQVTVVAVS